MSLRKNTTNSKTKPGDGEYEKDNSSAVIETLKFTLKADVIKKLASGKKVEMQLGKNEFVFGESQLEAIKEFYNQLVPQQ